MHHSLTARTLVLSKTRFDDSLRVFERRRATRLYGSITTRLSHVGRSDLKGDSGSAGKTIRTIRARSRSAVRVSSREGARTSGSCCHAPASPAGTGRSHKRVAAECSARSKLGKWSTPIQRSWAAPLFSLVRVCPSKACSTISRPVIPWRSFWRHFQPYRESRPLLPWKSRERR